MTAPSWQPRISVIIPLYNYAAYIAEAVASVFGQSYPPAELIVVNDGSTDNSAAVVTALHPPPATTFILVHQPNQGPAAARNRGITLSSGELIAFLDADDVWLSDKLEHQVAHLAQEPTSDGVICHVETFVEPGSTWPPGRDRAHFEQKPPMYLFSTLLMRRAALDRVGLLDPKRRAGEDTEWFARSRDIGLVIKITPATLLRRRFHFTNLSQSTETATPKQLLDIVRDSLQRKRHE